MVFKFNSIRRYLVSEKKLAEWFFLIFYAVGFFGLAIPVSQHLFLKLFPLALLLSFMAILLFHSEAYSAKTIFVLIMIGFCGFLIEVAGVNTHAVFGDYSYGNALGIKVFNTPLLIGINWIMLTYAGSSITEGLKVPLILKILLASLIMLVYDGFLEQVAPDLDMWYWKDSVIPLQNYLAWFFIALVFQIVIKVFSINTQNLIAWKIIVIQVLFFLSLILFF